MDGLHELLEILRSSLTDDSKRFQLQFLCIYALLGIVSTGMTLVNVVTAQRPLMYITLLFALVCLMNVILALRGHACLNISIVLFLGGVLAMFVFFLITGTPEGFSAIWICLLPSCALLLLGRFWGTLISAAMFAVLMFFFHTDTGAGLLHFQYTAAFTLRFPLLYLAFYFVSLFLETIRIATQRELFRSQEQYRYLYRHDALTGIYNRHGFNERIDRFCAEPARAGLALFIADIDHFKAVNDRYGHTKGDSVLRDIARQLRSAIGERGDVCRWGGEEFAVLLRGVTDVPAQAESLCHLIRQTPILLDDVPIFITISIGAVWAEPGQNISPSALVLQADDCLYRAKAAGRDCAICEPLRAAAGSATGEEQTVLPEFKQ